MMRTKKTGEIIHLQNCVGPDTSHSICSRGGICIHILHCRNRRGKCRSLPNSGLVIDFHRTHPDRSFGTGQQMLPLYDNSAQLHNPLLTCSTSCFRPVCFCKRCSLPPICCMQTRFHNNFLMSWSQSFPPTGLPF